jgi:hypothetical protein
VGQDGPCSGELRGGGKLTSYRWRLKLLDPSSMWVHTQQALTTSGLQAGSDLRGHHQNQDRSHMDHEVSGGCAGENNVLGDDLVESVKSLQMANKTPSESWASPSHSGKEREYLLGWISLLMMTQWEVVLVKLLCTNQFT